MTVSVGSVNADSLLTVYFPRAGVRYAACCRMSAGGVIGIVIGAGGGREQVGNERHRAGQRIIHAAWPFVGETGLRCADSGKFRSGKQGRTADLTDDRARHPLAVRK